MGVSVWCNFGKDLPPKWRWLRVEGYSCFPLEGVNMGVGREAGL